MHPNGNSILNLKLRWIYFDTHKKPDSSVLYNFEYFSSEFFCLCFKSVRVEYFCFSFLLSINNKSSHSCWTWKRLFEQQKMVGKLIRDTFRQVLCRKETAYAGFLFFFWRLFFLFNRNNNRHNRFISHYCALSAWMWIVDADKTGCLSAEKWNMQTSFSIQWRWAYNSEGHRMRMPNLYLNRYSTFNLVSTTIKMINSSLFFLSIPILVWLFGFKLLNLFPCIYSFRYPRDFFERSLDFVFLS